MRALDTTILRLYIQALEKYKDSGSLWSSKIDNAQYDWIPAGRIYVTDPALVVRYGLETESRKLPYSGLTISTVSSESIQQIWSHAAVDVEAADSLVVAQLRNLIPQ